MTFAKSFIIDNSLLVPLDIIELLVKSHLHVVHVQD